jgi:hypothetical protein
VGQLFGLPGVPSHLNLDRTSPISARTI